jgi:uncharacterized tellurite resistance protein B-like protein
MRCWRTPSAICCWRYGRSGSGAWTSSSDGLCASLRPVSSASADVPPKVFALELVRLLVQVAWADHDVAPAEAEALLTFARRSGLGATELEGLSAMLAGRKPLVPPNLGLLKERRTEVLRAVKELLLSDLEVAEEEEEILSQIAALLG